MTLCRCGASSGGPVLDNRMVSEEEHGPPRGTGIWTLRGTGVCTCHSVNTVRKAFCVVRTESDKCQANPVLRFIVSIQQPNLLHSGDFWFS